ADRNRSHWSTSKTPSYTKSVSWQHHLTTNNYKGDIGKPHMSVAGFVTGINEGALRKKLGELLTELANS
ncbi:hypothetical protein MZE99_23315, partial [Escherichia coli]|nr:hypothetical protein [Escherichia coli]